MHLRTLVTMIMVSPALAFAEEQAAEGGRSPDGAYEVRISGVPQTDVPAYDISIYSLKPEKHLFSLPDIGGYLRYSTALERDHAYWHKSSHYVAITDQGTRHSRELYIVDVSGGRSELIKQPDFYQNALGRIDAVEVDFARVVTPQKWDGDDLFLQLYLTANNQRSYTFEVVLQLIHGPQTAPRLALKSVRKMKEEEG